MRVVCHVVVFISVLGAQQTIRVRQMIEEKRQAALLGGKSMLLLRKCSGVQCPGSGIGFLRILDPLPIYLRANDNLLDKKYLFLPVGSNSCCTCSKIKIIFNIVKFVVTKKDNTTNFFPSFDVVVRSGIRDG
jgi:hypothetical protein